MRFATKMMLGFMLILSVTFGVGGTLLIFVSFSQSLSSAVDAAMSSQRMLMYTLEELSGSSSPTDSYDKTAEASKMLDGQNTNSWLALRLSGDGGTIYESPNDTPFADGLVESTDATHRASIIFRSETGQYLLQIAGQFEAKNGTLRLEAVYDLSSVYEARQSQLGMYRQLFAAIIVLGSLLAWVLSRFLTRPLRTLSRATKKLTSGDLTSRVEIKGRDEIGRLAMDFNQMADRLEENINELREAMRRQEEFMGSVAHELKTPLTSIIGYSDLLRGETLSESEKREAANYIFSEGRRLESLSLKLLDLIVLKKRDLPLVQASPAQILSQAVKLLKPVLEKQNITICTRSDGGYADLEPDLVKSLIINLTDNARKALDKGGEILIESETKAGGCVIRVTDNGRGMAPEEHSKITDAFYRVDKSRSRAQGGVGLGLTLCSEIAKLHNGTISFESVPGKGTRVTVELKGGLCS